MPRALDQHLDALFPRAPHERPDFRQLRNLGAVCGVGDAAGPQPVAEADGHVVFVQDVKQVVVVLVKRVLVARHLHPGEQQRAAAGDDVHLPPAAQENLGGPAVQAGVDGHKIHAFLRVDPHDVQKVARRDALEALLQIADGVVDRHGADGGGGTLNQLCAEPVRFPVVAQVHDGFGSESGRELRLFHLFRIVRAVSGDAEVDVDFRPQLFADAVRPQGFVADVRRNHGLPGGDQPLQLPLGNPLVPGHGGEFFGDNAVARGLHLCPSAH